MDEERERQVLRDALYEGFEPPTPDLRETVLASVGVAPAVPALIAWLQAHWPFLTSAFTVTGIGVVVAVAVVLNQPRPAPPPPAVQVYVGYADTIHPGAQAQQLPDPWSGSPNVVFQGTGPEFDAGAVRIDNPSDTAVTVDRVTVDIGAQHFEIWPTGLRVPAHSSLILTQTRITNPDPFTTDFDTSEANSPNCQPSTETPVVHVTVAGKVRDYKDVGRALTAGGVDRGTCGGQESHPWEPLRQ
jgi:hypothetical protein